MYYIIETEEQLAKLPKVDKCFIDLITLSEDTHPNLTSPCVLYYNDFQKGYILPFNHTEGFSLSLQKVKELLLTPTVYLFDKKWHSYFLDLPNAIDINQVVLDQENILSDFNCFTNVHNDFYNKLRYSEEVNTLVPISKHYERCECMFEAIKHYIGKEQNLPWINAYTEAYKWVEEQGIGVDEKLFDKHFEPTWKARSIKNGIIYTKYNLYNITSRPTSAFNGINFLALTKDNQSRAAFVPKNDIFIEFDFDGYHPRLIANMLNIELPTDRSIHEVLGQQYFEKEELTPEEYQESKKITFRQLYNGVEDRYKGIELFKQIADFIKKMYVDYQEKGYITLPNGRLLKQNDFSPQKLFNYYVQCLETVNNVKKLTRLKELFKDRKSSVVLVVYDSILIDYSKEEEKGFLAQIKNVLEEDGYRVKAQKGLNYDFYQQN
jgi:hypothetical protein